MPQQLNGTQLICCRLHKKKKKEQLDKWFQFKCDLLHFSKEKKARRGERVWVLCWALQPLHSPLNVSSCAEEPAVMTSLRSAEHLQPGRGLRQSVACLCRWHLLPWGHGIISPLFFFPRSWMWTCVCGFFYYMWGCDEWEKRREEHFLCTHVVVVYWKDQPVRTPRSSNTTALSRPPLCVS